MRKATSTETIATVFVEDGNSSLTVFFDNVPSEFDSFTTPEGVTATLKNEYTWGVVVDIENTTGADASVEVVGFPYRVTGRQRVTLDNTESIRRNGVIEYTIGDNPLIQTRSQAQAIAEILIDSFTVAKRRVILDVVPDASLEVSDRVAINGNGYDISKSEINFALGQMAQSIGGIA